MVTYVGDHVDWEDGLDALEQCLALCEFKKHFSNLPTVKDVKEYDFKSYFETSPKEEFYEALVVAFLSISTDGHRPQATRHELWARSGRVFWSAGVCEIAEPEEGWDEEEMPFFEWEKVDAVFCFWRNGFGEVWTGDVLEDRIREVVERI